MTKLYDASKSTTIIRQTRQLLNEQFDILNKKPVLDADGAVFNAAGRQAETLIDELILIHNSEPALHTLLKEVRNSTLRIGDVSEQFLTQEQNILILQQLLLEAMDTLGKSSALLQKQTDDTFNTIYQTRFMPLIVGIALTLISFGFALWSGLSTSRRIDHSIQNLLRATTEFAKGNLHYQASIIEPDELGRLTHAFNKMAENLRTSTVSRIHLEAVNRTLEEANKELEAFSYSVSHDLRAPLRAIDGFGQALLEDYGDKLDDTAKKHVARIRAATLRMAKLIDDILKLSRISRAEMHKRAVNLSEIALRIANELRESQPDRQVDFSIQKNITGYADPDLMTIVISNLLGNSWKYTSKHSHARIQVGVTEVGGKKAYYVRDDGAGFDMSYANKLFGPFQRLHGENEFPGTGIGLATVKRIIHRHGGTLWAEGKVERGATFYFTLSEEALDSPSETSRHWPADLSV